VINWMFEVEDVEDAACTVDDMEVRGKRWNEGSGIVGRREGVETTRWGHVTGLRHYLVEAIRKLCTVR
jgi:hypothetical protein